MRFELVPRTDVPLRDDGLVTFDAVVEMDIGARTVREPVYQIHAASYAQALAIFAGELGKALSEQRS